MRQIFVGNDIVDLGEPRTEGRASDDRFVARVFDEEERIAIRAAPDGDLELWTRWAAKEAGYKVVTKLVGAPLPFVHREFKVEWDVVSVATGTESGHIVREGRTSYEDHDAQVFVAWTPGHVHAVAFGGSRAPAPRPDLHAHVAALDSPGSPWAGTLEELEARFTQREWDAVYSTLSAGVRLGARADLAQALGVEEERLEIVCDPGSPGQRPPRVFVDGERAAADVSLSHDGRWIAWVLWIDTPTERT